MNAPTELCQMRYPHKCAMAASVFVTDIPGGKWMCNPCAKEWPIESEEAYQAFREGTRGVDYGR